MTKAKTMTIRSKTQLAADRKIAHATRNSVNEFVDETLEWMGGDTAEARTAAVATLLMSVKEIMRRDVRGMTAESDTFSALSLNVCRLLYQIDSNAEPLSSPLTWLIDMCCGLGLAAHDVRYDKSEECSPPPPVLAEPPSVDVPKYCDCTHPLGFPVCELCGCIVHISRRGQ